MRRDRRLQRRVGARVFEDGGEAALGRMQRRSELCRVLGAHRNLEAQERLVTHPELPDVG